MDLYEMKQALNTGKTIYDLPLRVTYYARVSTDKDEQLHSLSAQVQYYSSHIQSVPTGGFLRDILTRESAARASTSGKISCG